MANRIEGQVWLSRENPCVMKYFAQSEEYWVQSAASRPAGTSITKGMVVALNTSGKVIPAVFPRDVARVLGISLNTALTNEVVRIVPFGYIRISGADLAAAFATASDLNAGPAASSTYYASGNYAAGCAGNGWNDSAGSKNGISRPVFWFIGRTYKTGASSYEYADSASFGGKLTLATPSGYRFNISDKPWNDSSLDVCYKNLPLVGSVIDYEYNAGTKAITSITIHVNFSQFDKRIQFTHPASGLIQHTAGVVETNVRHGLFPNNASVPHVEVCAWGYTDNNAGSSADGEGFALRPGYDSYIGSGVDKRTEVEVSSDSPFYYKIVGDVNYNDM
jgi:hypothetical protein